MSPHEEVANGEEEIAGPWRATRLWNTIVRNFRAGMPLKKHKKNMRTYENCFTSSEAIDWLQKSLQKNPNFGPDVNKDQTVQLLKKLYRAGVIENARGENSDEEFKVSGELYKFSAKSPARHLRTPKYENRKPLVEVEKNSRNIEETKQVTGRKATPLSENVQIHKAKEDMHKLNLSYFRALPPNSLIVLDNSDTWKRVFVHQLSVKVSQDFVDRLEFSGQLDMEHLVHNMTRVSPKGIVQVADKQEDLPHWVLSAMKCLANWPRQLRIISGKETCLPSYSGFENDVFNVIKDYFLSLPGPLAMFSLYDFFIEAHRFARSVPVSLSVYPPISSHGPMLTSSSFQDSKCMHARGQGVHVGSTGFFNQGTVPLEHLHMLPEAERRATLRNTFAQMALSDHSKLSHAANSHSTSFSTSNSTADSFSPIANTSDNCEVYGGYGLPPKTCYETAFMEERPITRIVPQKEHEVLHFRRSHSGRSLSYIPSGWAQRSASTQTEQSSNSCQSNSLQRLPKWRRTSRLRKSVAVMEHRPLPSTASANSATSSHPGAVVGVENRGFVGSPASNIPSGRLNYSEYQDAYSVGAMYGDGGMRMSSSVDNLLDREREFEQDFMLKFRQVSGDLRSSCDLEDLAKKNKDRTFIESKTLRKEKRKKRWKKNTSSDCLNDDILSWDCRYQESLRPGARHSRDPWSPSEGLERAPLARQEECNISPVVPPGQVSAALNSSYRMATKGGNPTPNKRYSLPRTSTQITLDPIKVPSHACPRPCCQELYGDINCNGSSKLRCRKQSSSCDQHFSMATNNCIDWTQASRSASHFARDHPRHTVCRTSRISQSTLDSGRFSDLSKSSSVHQPNRKGHCVPDGYSVTVPSHILKQKLEHLSGEQKGSAEDRAVAMFQLLTLLLPPANRRKLQLLLKFVRKVSLNEELKLSTELTNRDLSLKIFSPVAFRSAEIVRSDQEASVQIFKLFLDRYDEILYPPESLRKEVEEQVYMSLVSKRLQAGEDPYPVAYCRQISVKEYEKSRMSGADTALLDLLDTLLSANNLSEKERNKKLKRFKESYPTLWRKKFPSVESEPSLGNSNSPKKKFSSLSKLRNAIGV